MSTKSRIPFIILFLFIYLTSWGQTENKFPVPPTSPDRLFYIQRSSNPNTIIYDANFSDGKTLHDQKPVHAYWIRYGENGQKEELSYIQRVLAYGINATKLNNPKNTFSLEVVSYKKRKLILALDGDGKPYASININNKPAKLDKVFVMVKEGGWMPKVLYVELFGQDLKTGTSVYEKFTP